MSSSVILWKSFKNFVFILQRLKAMQIPYYILNILNFIQKHSVFVFYKPAKNIFDKKFHISNKNSTFNINKTNICFFSEIGFTIYAFWSLIRFLWVAILIWICLYTKFNGVVVILTRNFWIRKFRNKQNYEW